ncbi:MAG: hypothetical protein MUC48_23835 [Leptolyngbya sp. Prado105]|jgi:hypothetical protein|nr:hypothetical protein [Leptolyngbya sp. Prado105]
MPQNISGTPVATQPSVQVDSYADRLMDDLFEDVEDLLSGSVPPPEPVRARPQKQPEIVMPTAISSIVARPTVSMPSLPQWSPAAAMPEMDELIAAEPIQPQNNRLLKFLTIAFGLTAVAAASLWLIQRGTFQRLFAVATQEPTAIATSTPLKTPAKDTNAQFAKYMQRSLENLDRKAANKPATVTPFKNSLPPVAVAGNPTAPKSNAPVVINVPSLSSPMPVATAVSKNPQELNQVLTRLSSVLERLSINPASNPIAAKPNVPASPVTTSQPAPAEPQRLLRGIAIATDPTQSAILFEMNGVTQRYYIGESIGSSGWSVVDIANNYVTVRKNGEIRSISIGQKL